MVEEMYTFKGKCVYLDLIFLMREVLRVGCGWGCCRRV